MKTLWSGMVAAVMLVPAMARARGGAARPAKAGRPAREGGHARRADRQPRDPGGPGELGRGAMHSLKARPRAHGLGGALVFAVARIRPLKTTPRSCVGYGP